MRYSHNYGIFVRLMFLMSVQCIAGAAFSQVVIEKQHIQNIFTAGSFHYYTPGVEGSFNIGKPGGPNVYDFSSISLQSLSTSNNYEVSTISALAGRYPAGAVTFGDSPTTIEKNPVFLFGTDTVYVLGQASLFPSYQFVHYGPAEIMAVFPTVYGATISQNVERFDTTFNPGGSVASVNHSSSQEVTTIDGYGTLKLSGRESPCIRVKKEHRGYGDKEYVYMTRDGAFMLVGGVPITSPDSGFVPGGAQLLLSPTLADVAKPEEIAGSYALQQNYPNPFNPSTRIHYNLAKSGYVSLTVHNLLGQKIAQLVGGTLDAGHHEVEFNGSGLASGVYWCRMQVNDFVQTRKLLLLR